jgi:hypothetical protein
MIVIISPGKMAHPKTFHYLRAHTMVEKLLDPTYQQKKQDSLHNLIARFKPGYIPK